MSTEVTAPQQQAHAHANAAQVKVLAEHLRREDATRLDDSAGLFLAAEKSEAGSTKDLGSRPRDPVADVVSPSREGGLLLTKG